MPVPSARNRLIGAVHAACKAMDDDTYRAMLTRITGKSSSKDLTDAQLRQVLDHVNGKKPGERRFAPPQAANPTAQKARALWISLHALGAVSDPSEAALGAWVRNKHHVDSLAWVKGGKAFAVIEGLKQWCARLGVDWSLDADPRLCIIDRQITLYREKYGAMPTMARPDISPCLTMVITFASVQETRFTSRQLDHLIVELGEKLRGTDV